jgi:hypothetical protein
MIREPFDVLCMMKYYGGHEPSEHFVQFHRNQAEHPCLHKYRKSVITIIVVLVDETYAHKYNHLHYLNRKR